ncbi:SRPBCC family protein [Sandaracinobacteroides hominis]|uniref:SRPBCC family protein n=1 Tax=Sandaracinobacteroides hominis TaxID=2780086 RepID=UPI0018F30907|nr:SRPBCC family protein [Sandaracinobacteroides hominis]
MAESGTADMVTERALRFERLLDAPVERVWQFLVDPELRARWFMGGPTDARVGGAMTMTMQHDNLSDGNVEVPERYRPYLGNRWEEHITRCEPPKLLAITWENGKAGEVLFELSEAGPGKTRLILTHSGLRGRADALNFGGGWHSHLAALERRVRNEPVQDFWALHAAAEAEVAKALEEAG